MAIEEGRSKTFFNENLLLFIYLHSDNSKVNLILQETKRNQQMANQIAYRTFTTHAFDQGTLPLGQEVRETYFLQLIISFPKTHSKGLLTWKWGTPGR